MYFTGYPLYFTALINAIINGGRALSVSHNIVSSLSHSLVPVRAMRPLTKRVRGVGYFTQLLLLDSP